MPLSWTHTRVVLNVFVLLYVNVWLYIGTLWMCVWCNGLIHNIYIYVFRRYLLNKNLDLHGSVIYALGQSFYKYLRKTYIYINCVKSTEYILLAVVVIKLDVTQLKPPTKRNTIYLVVQSRGLNPLPLASFNGSDHKS